MNNRQRPIRKEGKARWIYKCSTCDAAKTGPDHWTVYEFQWNHERTLAHASKLIVEVFQPLVGFINKFTETVNLNLTQEVFAPIPPPNLPHDPALLKDRRKWGGR